jgi:hypothetical protein
VKWVFSTPEFAVNQGLAVAADGTVYFGTSNINAPPYGFLWAVNADGTLKWRYPEEGTQDTGYAYTAPLVDGDGTIYMGFSGGSFRAINPDGTLKWVLWLSGQVPRGSPVLGADGTLYQPFSATLYAFGEGNLPPEADAGGPYSGIEGAGIVLGEANAADPENDILTYGWTVDSGLCSFTDPSIINATLSCSDNGNFTAVLTVSDGVNDPVSSEAYVTAINVAPSVDVITVPLDPVNINDQSMYTVDVTFSDPAGVNDEPYTCDFDLDSNGAVDVTVSQTMDASCSTLLNYTDPGVYIVKAIVTDKDGGSGSATATDFIVIYDPTDGFVTGGGWIWSEAGWCLLNTVCNGVGGKANFGFVSRYQSGATAPSGNTEFNFSAGGLNFHSDVYEWLVVNQGGTNAQFKGSGTINGELAPNGTAYRFMIWATDGGQGGVDTFRIKIWYEDNGSEVAVYDNGTNQAIGGGNIAIHQS